ncbi:MAG: DsbE family thiol:disulfide interchange protein [Acidocella sp.]|nr:DsbE family thiol:disulfide interchange protein [Acidocella sp.]
MLAAPLLGAGLAGAGSLALLGRMRRGTFDPHAINDPLVGHLFPEFQLPPQPPAQAGFSGADLRAAGTPVLLNFFASWCVPCLQEAPTLMALHDATLIPIWGIAYQDTPGAAAGFLARNGNPYARLARDESGTTAINFGLYGVPESYLIDRSGIIRWRFAGPLTEDTGLPKLRALLVQYQ